MAQFQSQIVLRLEYSRYLHKINVTVITDSPFYPLPNVSNGAYLAPLLLSSLYLAILLVEFDKQDIHKTSAKQSLQGYNPVLLLLVACCPRCIG